MPRSGYRLEEGNQSPSPGWRWDPHPSYAEHASRVWAIGFLALDPRGSLVYPPCTGFFPNLLSLQCFQLLGRVPGLWVAW